MRKRLLAIFVALVMVIGLLPVPLTVQAAPALDIPNFEGQMLHELDMAFGRPVRASANSTGTGMNVAANAVNHAPTMWWTATGSPHWFIVDLGDDGPHEFNSAYIRFRAPESLANAQIQVSNYTGALGSAALLNDANWTTVHTAVPNRLYGQLEEFEAVTTARFVRLVGTRSSGTGGGLTFFQIYNITHPSMRDLILHPPFSYMAPYDHFVYQPGRVDAQIVAPQADGSLHYTDFNVLDINNNLVGGNTMPDFSVTGFRSSNMDIPFVDIHTIRLYPSGGDDTAQINQAIIAIGNRTATDANGFRGVVELAPGTFRVYGATPILMNLSGVVLRGSGQGPDGTVILHSNFAPGGFGMNNANTILMGRTAADAVRFVLDTPVVHGFHPIGTNQVPVVSTDGFEVGDRIMIRRSVTPAWTTFLNAAIGVPGEWGPGEGNIASERVIADICRTTHTITIEGTLTQALNIPTESTAIVSLVDDSLRPVNIGVENLRMESNYNRNHDRMTLVHSETHPATAIRITGARDVFIRDITTLFYSYATVNSSTRAMDVTVLNSTSLEPVVAEGSGRRYAFVVDDGKNTLMDGNYSQYARYCFVTNSGIAGPVVFLDGLSENNTVGPETHHRWANGILFDNINAISGGRFNAINRGSMGSGHGLAGSMTVFWNSTGRAIYFAHPATSQNFGVGVSGMLVPNPDPWRDGVGSPLRVCTRHGGTSTLQVRNAANNFRNQRDIMRNDGLQAVTNYSSASVLATGAWIEAGVQTVRPQSLFRAQLAYRHTGNFNNAVPNRPILLNPMPDAGVPGTFVISGIYDRFADTVSIYINGDFHGNATLHGAARNWEFSYVVELPPGYHVIQATLTEGNFTSARTAVRVVNVRNADGTHNSTPSSFEFNHNTASISHLIVYSEANLVEVIAPEPIVDLPSGTAKTAQALRLPSRVAIVTDAEFNNTQRADVVWNVAEANYDPANINAQTFTVTGTVTLPDNVSNPHGVSQTVTVTVSVLRRMAFAGVTPFEPITGLPNGTPRTVEALGLPAEVELTMEDGAPSVYTMIIWDILGSDYRPWLTAEQTFTVTGTFLIPDFVSNPNNIPLTVTIEVTVEADTATINRVLVDIDSIWADVAQDQDHNNLHYTGPFSGQPDNHRWSGLVGMNYGARPDSVGESSTCPVTGVRSVNLTIPLMYEYVLDSLRLGFFGPATGARSYIFNIYHSMDGENWTRAQLGGDAVPVVYTRNAAITPVPVNAYTVPGMIMGEEFRVYNIIFTQLVTANYVRLTGYGHIAPGPELTPGMTIAGSGEWFVVNYIDLNGSRTIGEPSHQLTLADNRWSIITEATFPATGFVEPAFGEENQVVIARMGSDVSHAAPANTIVSGVAAGPQNALSHNGTTRYTGRLSVGGNSGSATVLNGVRTGNLVADFGTPKPVDTIDLRFIEGSNRWSLFNIYGSNDGTNWSPIPVMERHDVYAVNVTAAFHYSTPSLRQGTLLAPEEQFPALLTLRSSVNAQCEITSPTIVLFEHSVMVQFIKLTYYGSYIATPQTELPEPDENGVRHFGIGTIAPDAFDWFNVNSFRVFGQGASERPDEPVTGVELNETELEMGVGETATLVATVLPNNAANRDIVWSSSDENIATVSATGLVTGVAVGTATITVTTVDGDFTATAEVTVIPPPAVAGVELNEPELEIAVGATATLVATVLPANAANRSVVWSSSDEDIATVSTTGVVTGVAVGTATITVTTVEGGFTATAEVTVVPPPAAPTDFIHPEYGVDFASQLALGNGTNTAVAWAHSFEGVNTGLIASTPSSTTSGQPLWLMSHHRSPRYTTAATAIRWQVNTGSAAGTTMFTLDYTNTPNMPVPNQVTFDKIILNNNGGTTINEFRIEISDNGVDFEVVHVRNRTNNLAPEVQSPTAGAAGDIVINFETPITTRFIRYNVTDLTANNMRVYTFQVYDTSVPQNVYAITLTPSADHTFAPQVVGYATSALTLHEVTVANTGNAPTGALTVSLTGENAAAFELSQNTIASLEAGDTASFTVVPVAGLEAGTYTATVTVAGNNNISESFNVTFTVTPDDSTGPFTLTLENFSPPGMTPQEYTHTLDAGETLNRIVNGFGLNQHGGIIRGGEVVTDGWVRNFQLRDWVVVSPQDFELGGTAWSNRTVTMPNSNVTLQGDWEQHGGRYAIITFNANSGEFCDGETEVEKRSRVHEYWVGGSRPFPSIVTLGALAPTPEKAGGYTFVGWSATNDGDVLSPGTLMDAPKTLYAIWVGPPRIVDVTPNPVTVHQDGTAEITVVTENMPAGAWVDLNVAWRPGLSIVGGPRFYIGEDGTAVVTIAAAANAPLGQDGFGLAARVADQWGTPVNLDSTILVITVVEPPTPAIVEVIPNPVTVQQGSTVTITVVTEHMPAGAWVDLNVAWRPGLSVVGGPRFYIGEDGIAVVTIAAAANAPLGQDGFGLAVRVADQWGAPVIVDHAPIVIIVEPAL